MPGSLGFHNLLLAYKKIDSNQPDSLDILQLLYPIIHILDCMMKILVCVSDKRDGQ